MSETRWLNKTEQAAWRSYLTMHAQLSVHINRSLIRESGLSEADFAVLVHLSEAPAGRLRAFELSHALQWEKSRLSHHLARMQRRDLVERRDCEGDGRGAFVVITADGLETIRRAAPQHVAEVRKYFVDLLTSDELAMLERISSRVTEKLDETCKERIDPRECADTVEP